MQTYDFIMLLVLAGATMFGFVKGLAWQVAYIASLVVSYFVALNFSAQLAPKFGQVEPWNRFIAMLVIYIGCSLVIWILFRGVSGFIDRVKLKEFDRQMGALVGFGRGVLWCVAITFFAVTLVESQRNQILSSRSGHYIAQLLDKTDAVVPKEIHDVIGPYLDRARSEIDPSRAGVEPPAGADWPTNTSPQPSTNTGAPAWPTSGGVPAWPTTTSPPAPANPQAPAWPSSTPTQPPSGW